MKTRTKRVLIGIGVIFGALIVLRVTAAFIWPTINDVRTGATVEYPDLQPQRFTKPFDQVFAAALVAGTRVFRLKDDVTITIGRDGQVNVHSRSRIGKGDLGTNARRIRDFQARLGTRL